MAQFSPVFEAIKKKSLQGKMAQFSPDFNVISKKIFDLPQTDLSVVSIGPMRPLGPRMSSLKPMGP